MGQIRGCFTPMGAALLNEPSPLLLAHRLPSLPHLSPPPVPSHLRRLQPAGLKHPGIPRRDRLPGPPGRPALFLTLKPDPLLHVGVERTKRSRTPLKARTLPSRIHVPTHPSHRPSHPRPRPLARPPRHRPPSPPQGRSQPSAR